MSREIKFRAWQPHNSLHRKPGMYFVGGLEFYNQHGGGEAFLVKNWKDEAQSSEYFDDIKLMQYTGLKDKNGVEIYEGDIVRTEKFTAQIVYDFGQFQTQFQSLKSLYDVRNDCFEGDVIGNIYENPDLTNQKDEG